MTKKKIIEKLLSFMSARTGMFDFEGCARWILKHFTYKG